MVSLAGFEREGSHFPGWTEPLLGVPAHPDWLVSPVSRHWLTSENANAKMGTRTGRSQGYGGYEI
jgi:hypothetical protein